MVAGGLDCEGTYQPPTSLKQFVSVNGDITTDLLTATSVFNLDYNCSNIYCCVFNFESISCECKAFKRLTFLFTYIIIYGENCFNILLGI